MASSVAGTWHFTRATCGQVKARDRLSLRSVGDVGSGTSGLSAPASEPTTDQTSRRLRSICSTKDHAVTACPSRSVQRHPSNAVRELRSTRASSSCRPQPNSCALSALLSSNARSASKRHRRGRHRRTRAARRLIGCSATDTSFQVYLLQVFLKDSGEFCHRDHATRNPFFYQWFSAKATRATGAGNFRSVQASSANVSERAC